MANSRFSIAIHTLALLAHQSEKPLKSEYIACLVKTNPVVIRRMLIELSRANLVVSQAGAAGGTRLSRRPEEISLWEIYQAASDGQVFTLHRKTPDEHCDIGRSIQAVLGAIQAKMDAAIEASLGKISLAEVLEMIKAENENCRAKWREEKTK
jgi:Rrf2 family protein